MATRRIFAFCLLGLACLAALVTAEDNEDNEEPTVTEGDADDAAVEAADGEEAPVEAADADEGSEDPLRSAKELSDKLAQLQDLLEKTGAGDNLELKEKLAGLKKQLGSLGLDGSDPAGTEALTEFINLCMVLSIRRSGMSRSSTTSAFQRIGDPATKLEDVVDLELTKLISVCVLESSQEELVSFKTASQEGRASTLPAWMVKRAQSKDIRDVILKSMDAQLWGEVQKLAGQGMDTMKDQMGGSGLPMAWGVLALVPVVGAVAFLASRFMAMQKEKSQKKEKKTSKKQK